MENEAAGPPPAGKMPYEAALVEVVKGLKDDPILLFGIGAGIVVVGALAITSSLLLVLVVAGVLLAVLIVGGHRRTQAVRKGVEIGSAWSSIRNNRLFASRMRIRSIGSTIEGNVIGEPGDRHTTPED
jgi:hypothetical protein